MTCPECGEMYVYHYEFTYTCPNGHSWRCLDLIIGGWDTQETKIEEAK